MKKSVNWMKTTESDRLDQFDQFSLKIASAAYQAKYGLTAAQVTALRNDYLWYRHAVTATQQFEQEWRNRVTWKKQLAEGPESTAAAQVPSLGSEFSPPMVSPVPDGVLIRWRNLVSYLKNHPAYVKADGLDLNIEPVGQPSQSMKPTARLTPENGHVVRISVFKDGHDSVIVWCRRGNETQPVKLGVFRRANIVDDRDNLVAGQPECREYTFQYVDNDVPVGEVSDIFRVVTTGLMAA